METPPGQDNAEYENEPVIEESVQKETVELFRKIVKCGVNGDGEEVCKLIRHDESDSDDDCSPCIHEKETSEPDPTILLTLLEEVRTDLAHAVSQQHIENDALSSAFRFACLIANAKAEVLGFSTEIFEHMLVHCD